jgi:hypothetical protein
LQGRRLAVYEHLGVPRPRAHPRGRGQTGRQAGHGGAQRLAGDPAPDGNLPGQGLGAHLWPAGDAHASHRHQLARGDHHLQRVSGRRVGAASNWHHGAVDPPRQFWSAVIGRRRQKNQPKIPMIFLKQ